MAIEQRSVEVGICDACRKYCPGGPNGEAPQDGVSGTVLVVNSVGNTANLPWFSCKTVPGHMGKAASKVREAALNADGAR